MKAWPLVLSIALALGGCARFGQFALEGGAGVVPKDWFADATREHAGVGAPGFGYGYQWWTYPAGMWGAQGIFGQAITVVPESRVVIVQAGNWPRASDPVLRREMWLSSVGSQPGSILCRGARGASDAPGAVGLAAPGGDQKTGR